MPKEATRARKRPHDAKKGPPKGTQTHQNSDFSKTTKQKKRRIGKGDDNKTRRGEEQERGRGEEEHTRSRGEEEKSEGEAPR